MELVKTDIRAMDAAGLEKLIVDHGWPRYRYDQISEWIWRKKKLDFQSMKNLPKDLTDFLETHFIFQPVVEDKVQISTDGTIKSRMKLHDGHFIESVLIPVTKEKRFTVCVSSQVGCSLSCSFCATGQMKRMRNLTAAEIFDQIVLVNEQALAHFDHPITNIVFMGMGEPLYNTDAVAEAIDILSDDTGMAIGRRRVTVSTSGVVPEIGPLGERTNAMLAISLHAANDELRTQIMPINKKYPLKELMDACRNYPGVSNARRITFEYVMLKGINDSPKHAKELIRLLEGIPAKVNLIPFNPWPGSEYECSDWETIERFGVLINKAGYAAPIRTPRGRDILAACGQLKSESEKMRASEKRRLAK